MTVLFGLLAIVLLVGLFSAEPQTTLLSALFNALIIVVPGCIAMLIWRQAFFLLPLLFFGSVLLDASGFPLSLSGLALWLFGGVTTFILTLSFYARYIAPPLNVDLNRTSYLSLLLLLRKALPSLAPWSKPQQHIPTNIAPSFSSIRAGEIPSHQSYAIYNGPRYSNGAFPGYTLLGEKDRIVDTVDLRPQRRSQKVNITTRDGIEVTTAVSVGFRVRPPFEDNNRGRLPYPFDRAAIRELVFANTVLVQGNEVTIPPFQQVIERAVLFVSEEMSRSTLDDLLRVNSSMVQPLEPVTDIVRDELQKWFKTKGLAITSVSLAPLQLPKAVQDARIDAWRRSWKAPIAQKRMGKGIGRISADQAKAQLQVIEDLMENLNTFADADSDIEIRDDILSQVREVITDAAAEGLLKSLIPDPKKDG